jgi:hypothetical protein
MIAELSLALLREKDALLEQWDADLKTYEAMLMSKDAEIERLNGLFLKAVNDAERERFQYKNICEPIYKAMLVDARAEAITEFAERTIEWCRKKLKFGKYQTIGLSGKRLEGYEAAMKAVMSYMHSLKSKDDFPNCKISGCEAARKDCHIGCPYGKENTDDSGTKI